MTLFYKTILTFGLSIFASFNISAANTFNVGTGNSINFEFITGVAPFVFDGGGLNLGVTAGSDLWDNGETLAFSIGSSLGSNDIGEAQITNFNPFSSIGLFARFSDEGILLPQIQVSAFSSIFVEISPINGSFDFNPDSGFAQLSSSVPGNPDLRGTFIPVVQSAVPEPATWLMMMIGFAIIGVSMKRRNLRQYSV